MPKYIPKQLPGMGGHSQFAKKLDHGPEIAQIGSAANRHIEILNLDVQNAALIYGHILKGPCQSSVQNICHARVATHNSLESWIMALKLLKSEALPSDT